MSDPRPVISLACPDEMTDAACMLLPCHSWHVRMLMMLMLTLNAACHQRQQASKEEEERGGCDI